MDNKNIDNINWKDKSIFILGFLAIFVALAPFKDDLSNIKVLSNPDLTLWNLLLVFIVILVVSIYLYALNYIKYILGKYQNSIIFKIITALAEFCYLLALLLPIIIVLWILMTKLPYSPISSNNWSIILSIISILTTIFATYKIFKVKKEALLELVEGKRIVYLDNALNLYSNGFYAETIIEIGKVLEIYLKKKLLEKGLTSNYMSLGKLIRFSNDENIINRKYSSRIADIVGMRNSAVHSQKTISKKDADLAIETIKEILLS
ncbi:MAG: HEPN domain-containing protein [Candidatus Paceibacterota bacterium]